MSRSLFFFCSIHSERLPTSESTEGLMRIAPIRENATAIRVVTLKLLMMANVARQSTENPKNVARPETVIAVPIFYTLSC